MPRDGNAHDRGLAISESLPITPSFRFTLKELLLAITAIAAMLATDFELIVPVVAVCLGFLWLRRRQFRRITWTAVALLVLPMLGIGTSVQLRTDTGDLRHLLWGIPYEYVPMPDKYRTQLVSLHSPGIRHGWTRCATKVGSNHPHFMVQHFFRDAAIWVREDRTIATYLVADIGNYLEATHGKRGLPDGVHLLFLVRPGGNLPAGWRQDPAVQHYLQSKHAGT